MSFARAGALRSLQSGLRHSGVRATARATRSTQLTVAKRFASDGGHGHAAPSSDLPWAIGAVAVTIPACWYLWPDKSHAAHGDHGDHGSHDAHEEAQEEKEEESTEGEEPAEKEESEEKSEEKSDDKSEEKSDDKSEEKSDDKSEEKSEEKSDAQEENSDDESDSSKTGKGKGKDLPDTRKVEDDSKGGSKKRIDSGLGKDLGKESKDGEPTGKAPEKGSDGNEGSIESKQFGLSTTKTKHSTEIKSDEKSTSADGTPETAKKVATVSTDRELK